ncbi:CRISPR-associated protein, Cas2 family [Rhodospirillum rubrum ATCC 11170]|uniref:CRISPR-associated endoribonuclease Cas2 2 n=2 Tax=Rhodospirillum rubrum TaxID=1085 RepID=CAS2B_RHORT|nr:RecName: Full=CRISPR-associated endoribonuclease Cas2 2 [Rhodospirillum rubrum ATCC 11170]ABC21257.1 CRISPR-associated protein, Cas2 family [Rhodospirillum rubrum ATCC 11170]MBK5952810.1 CRISPR-associated endonuclease Cas2 [Rhodospirillum rubrum]QXG80942.1 CRISPR-associated endonuclease Cas2 [Rhodospirillum rubrum]HAP99983.1 CRISPR-associated endonuclease Cas2 [Rhodospirillum rubrum]
MPDGWRKMGVLVFYDLPVVSPEQRLAAVRFHKFLLADGFERMHYSIYARYCGSMERAATYERRVEQALPAVGHVNLLKLTDRQMVGMRKWIRGNYRAPENAEFVPPAQYQLF